MGKKDRGNIWSSTAPKPKGFSFVKGEPLTYTYEVLIMSRDEYTFNSFGAKEIDKIYIKVKIKSVTEFGFGGVDIDKEYTKESIQKELGHDVKFEYDDHCFIRDRRMFPFVSCITVYTEYVENYKQHRLLKARREKIHKLKNKLI